MRNCLLVVIFLLLSVCGYSQCPQSVSITSSSPSICSGNSVTLTAKPSGGSSYTYSWSTGETKQSIDVNKAGTYKVTVTSAGCPPVFSSINITASATPNAPTVEKANISVCPNTPATLKAIGPGGLYQWYDASGNFLQDGDTYTTPPLTAGRNYYVTTTVGGCTSAKTQVTVSLASKPNVTNATICAGNQATLSADGGDSYEWYPTSAATGTPLSTNSTFLTQPLNITTTYYVVATNNGCRSVPTAVTATVTPAPQTPVVKIANPSVCSGSRASLHAEDAPGVFAWFDVPSGGTPLIYSPDFTTPPLTATKIYYVQNSVNDCESARTKVTVTVNPIPSAPAPQTVGACAGTTATINMPVIASISYEWYAAASGGNPITTANSFTTPVLNSSTNYYVQAVNSGGCSSTRTQIQVVVNAAPQVPSVSGQVICYNSQTILSPTGPGGVYKWYNVATGGTAITTPDPDNFATPPLKVTTTYYVETTISGCTSARVPVTVTVSPIVPPPTAAGKSVCSGDPATLTATGGSAADIYDWYATPTGGSSLFTGQTFLTPPITTPTTFYVQITDNDCSSTRTPVQVKVNPIPVDPTASNKTICAGTPAVLTANVPAGGTINWFDSPTGGTSLKTGSPFTTPVLATTTTYYVQNSIGTCTSNRVPVVVTVTSLNEPQFQYPTGTVCKLSSNVTPVINNPLGGTFSAPAGLVFVSNTTGEINVAASSIGKYTITFTGKGTCAVPETAAFSIVTTTSSTFSYKPDYCQDENNPKPTYSAGSSAGTFSATPTGLVFVNTGTGEIDLKKSKPGLYQITNDIAASGGCSSSSSNFSVTIHESVTAKAGPNQTVASGSPVQLNGSITGGATTGKWSGGTGSFSNANLTNAVYTPGPAETSATLTLTSDDPPGLCGPKTDKVIITFKNSPALPTVTGNSTCAGSTATLTAIAPGGTYNWYDVPTGGTPINTTAVYTTPVLLANATYYIEVTNSVGVTSPREAIVVTVNAVQAAPVVTGATAICVGNKTTLTTNDPTGYYTWYDAPVDGHKLLINSDTYTTPFLTSDQTYYVQKKVNECLSPMTAVTVTVSQVPAITSVNSDYICSGNPLNYTIISDVPTATFLWSRAAATGISNPPVSNQTSNLINETLINTSRAAVNVIYSITPINGTCSGTPFEYTVTVYPTPVVTSVDPAPICNGTSVNYTITFNTAANFSWSRGAFPGITNVPVSGQASNTIKEALFNTTNAPIEVTYTITSNTSTCPGTPFQMKVTVYPEAQIISAATNPSVCSGDPQNYVITPTIPSATYLWSRDAVNNISNDPVSNQTSSTIDEALINTGTNSVKVTYVIVPLANGCPGEPFKYVVTVKPPVPTPVANSNSPICIGSTLKLQTKPVPNATYLWTFPNGDTNTSQNPPDITNVTSANAGVYSLVIQVNGCSSTVATTTVDIRELPTAYAGKDDTVCVSDPAIFLHGKISGGTTTGIWTTASATSGTFVPSATDMNPQYLPTDADRAAGKVVFTLTSTSNDDCKIATDDVTVFFGPLPSVEAGPDQNVCAQTNSVKLDGKVFIASNVRWSSLGTGGAFIPSENTLNPTYVPSASDIAAGSVKLVLLATDFGPCDKPTDTLKINFIPPPTVNAGGTRYVLKNRTITLTPTVSDNNVQYLWTPNIGISDNTAKNPVITGDIDRDYVLQVTDARGCVSTDTTHIKVSPLIVIPNTFTPNGDGINDLWNIEGLIAYSDATVDIFTRYGQKVYHSIGYDKAWDGIYNGKELPTGVYYYVINTKLFNQVFSGSITIIR